MAKKATKAQTEQRIRIVYELLLSDAPRPDVLQYAATNWGIKTRSADMLIKKANDLIITEAARMRENALEKHLTQRALIRHKALKDGDKRLAFDILRDETKLLDLYPTPTNRNLNIDMSQLSDQQLEQIAAGNDPLAVLAASPEPAQDNAEVQDDETQSAEVE